MNTAETAGGSCRKGQENGDASNESERPLKKARFAWQVKGKYHLKNDGNDTVNAPLITSDPNKAESSGSASSSNNRGTEENLEILGDYLRKQDFKTLDCVISAPDESLAPSTSIPNGRISYPACVSSNEQILPNNVIKRSNQSSNTMRAVPLSMVVTQNSSEEQCIARWQTKQMVRGFVDNTINRVLDLWIQVPLPPEDDPSRSVVLDVADFINNLPGDNSVENEGILMAISAHGLQHPGSSNIGNTVDDSYLPDVTENINPLIPVQSDDESHEAINNSNQCDTDTSSNDLDMAWSYSDEQKNESNDMTLFPLFPDTTSLSYQSANESLQNSSTECDGIDKPIDNDCDFLDEAILFAIQSKGLTTFGSDYG